mmetsp:Transcript_115390/g.199306  ORF Transcript_115390/g.199306 Transcript_115390/m.199306 type:complete len:236 (+) Transcript_115390:3-710(+)
MVLRHKSGSCFNLVTSSSASGACAFDTNCPSLDMAKLSLQVLEFCGPRASFSTSSIWPSGVAILASLHMRRMSSSEAMEATDAAGLRSLHNFRLGFSITDGASEKVGESGSSTCILFSTRMSGLGTGDTLREVTPLTGNPTDSTFKLSTLNSGSTPRRLPRPFSDEFSALEIESIFKLSTLSTDSLPLRPLRLISGDLIVLVIDSIFKLSTSDSLALRPLRALSAQRLLCRGGLS